MAIYHLSVKTVSRSAGRCATAAAAYRAGVEIADRRTGVVYDYTRRGGVESADIVLPEGAPAWASDRSALWNAAELAETRKNSTVAREFEVALPAELSAEQRRELIHSFAHELAERHGIAVDAAIHAPDKDGDQRNHHAHILTSTRRLGADGFVEKARELDAKATGPMLIEQWRERWAELSNIALERAGHSVRVDHRSHKSQGIEFTPTTHVGVHATGMDRRGVDAERMAKTQLLRQQNAAKIAERPEIILEKLTQTQAVFSRRDVARELNRYIDDAEQYQGILVRLDASPELVKITPAERGEARYSTREMIAVETRMADTAERMASARSRGVEPAKIDRAIARNPALSNEQQAAIRHITGEGQIACVIGDAGTGKSFAMATARAAWESAGFRIRGAALSGKAAEGLQEGSGIESRTLASLERSWSKGYGALTSNDVLVIDEAGMIGARQLDRVLFAADKAGAKVVLLGDDKQLAAIEAGAPFRALIERNGAAEITEIRRQNEDWARRASQELARGSTRSGLDAYHERDAVHLSESREQAKTSLAAAWMRDRGQGTSIILAHANSDVQSLNREVRTACRDAGELGDEYQFTGERGNRTFAVGDRVVFLRNDQALGVKNGTLGSVVAGENGEVSVRLDGGQTVRVDDKQYAAIDHGYAITVHKAQGVTVDRTYVLASGGMDRSLAYVAMTRHRERAELFAGRDDFRDYDALARRLGRNRPKESTLDYTERRGDDRKSTLENARAWLDRGKERLAALADRATTAIRRTFERAGLRPADAPTWSRTTQQPMSPRARPERKATAALIAQMANNKRRAGGTDAAAKQIPKASERPQRTAVDKQEARRQQARREARERMNKGRDFDKGRDR